MVCIMLDDKSEISDSFRKSYSCSAFENVFSDYCPGNLCHFELFLHSPETVTRNNVFLERLY